MTESRDKSLLLILPRQSWHTLAAAAAQRGVEPVWLCAALLDVLALDRRLLVLALDALDVWHVAPPPDALCPPRPTAAPDCEVPAC